MIEVQLQPIEKNFRAENYSYSTTIHQLFETQVEKTPNQIAVSFEDSSLTYRQLNDRANQIAHYLIELGVKPEQLIGICVERSLEMIIGVLGVLKAGGGYVPLDPAYPQERLKFILEDAGISILLTQEKPLIKLPLEQIKVIFLNKEQSLVQQSQENPKTAVSSDNLAYILYTSGSTGLPKGVLITHKGVVNLVQTEIKLFNLNPSSRVLQFASLNFDASVSEIFTAICSGSQLCLGNSNSLLPGDNLLNFLQKKAITHAQIPPSVLAVLPQAPLKDLQVLIVGGEACPPALMAQWAVGRRFFNAYGPTEATVDATIAECSPDSPLTIGRPLANTQAYILDESLKKVAVGVAGELHIGGVGLARGYLNRPELTAAKFIPHPFDNNPSARLYKTGDLARYLPDGNIEWLGRIDFQVKIRGLRIELGEIEGILNENTAIHQAVVIFRQEQLNDPQLIAYAVINPTVKVEQVLAQWRDYLKEKLPHYMIPQALVILEKMPLTPNDKVDRVALAKLPLNYDTSRLVTPPRNPEEELLTAIWAEVLELEKVGIDENFFELGGHSLKVIALCKRLESHFEKKFAVETILDAATVAEFAEYLRKNHPELIEKIEKIKFNEVINPLIIDKDFIADSSLEIDSLSGCPYFPLSLTQQKRWAYEKSNTVVHFSGNFRRHYLKGDLNLAALTASLNEIIYRHQILRVTFREVNGSPVQLINPYTEKTLPIIDLQPWPENQKNEELARLLQEIINQPFDLINGPLIRLILIRLDEKDHILLTHIHDIIIDNSSLTLFFKELELLYQAFVLGDSSPLPPLPIQYVDYVQWQLKSFSSQLIEPKINHYKRILEAGEPPTLKIPPHPILPSKSSDKLSDSSVSSLGTNFDFEIPGDFTEKLNILCQEQRITLFMTALTAFAVLLYSYSGFEDIIIRAPRDARNHPHLKPLIGLISNIMLLRVNLSGNPTVKELLTQVRRVVLEALEYQDIPFEHLAKVIKPEYRLDNSSFKAVITVLSESPEEELKLPGLEVTSWEMEEFEVRPDLELILWENKTSPKPSLKGWWQYKKDYFELDSMTQINRDFMQIWSEIVTNPHQPVTIFQNLKNV